MGFALPKSKQRQHAAKGGVQFENLKKMAYDSPLQMLQMDEVDDDAYTYGVDIAWTKTKTKNGVEVDYCLGKDPKRCNSEYIMRVEGSYNPVSKEFGVMLSFNATVVDLFGIPNFDMKKVMLRGTVQMGGRMSLRLLASFAIGGGTRDEIGLEAEGALSNAGFYVAFRVKALSIAKVCRIFPGVYPPPPPSC